MNTKYSDGLFYKNNTRINPFISSNINSLKSGKAVDFGCGVGTNASYIEKLGWYVYAIDCEDIAIEKTREKMQTNNIFKADITNFNFSQIPYYDLALCNYVLQHINIKDAIVFIKNMVNHLVQNGHIIVSLFERRTGIDYATLIKYMSINCSLVCQKKWSRIDTDHGPKHHHFGVETLWIKDI